MGPIMTTVMVLLGMAMFALLFGWALQMLSNPPQIQIPQPRYDFSPAPAANTPFPAKTN